MGDDNIVHNRDDEVCDDNIVNDQDDEVCDDNIVIDQDDDVMMTFVMITLSMMMRTLTHHQLSQPGS